MTIRVQGSHANDYKQQQLNCTQTISVSLAYIIAWGHFTIVNIEMCIEIVDYDDGEIVVIN